MKPLLDWFAPFLCRNASRQRGLCFGTARTPLLLSTLFLGFCATAESATTAHLVAFGRRVIPYIEPGTRFKAVACGPSHAVALKTDGTLIGWGDNLRGQAAPPADLSNVVAVSAGGAFSVALRGDGTVFAWGGTFAKEVAVPPGLSNVVAISAGLSHTLALRADGTVVGWGNTADGRLALPADLSNVVSIAAGGRHSLVALADGTVRAFGYNVQGQVSVPAGLSNVVAVAAGPNHSAALQSDGHLVAWKGGGGGPGWPTNVVAITAGESRTYGLTSDGFLFDPSIQNVRDDVGPVVALASGISPAFAVRPDGQLTTWAQSTAGIDEYTLASEEFVAVANCSEGGANHLLALRPDGTVVSRWSGESGIVVRPPPDLRDVVAAVPGITYGMALLQDGTVATWRDLGKPDIYPIPSGLGSVVAIAAGASLRLALKADGTVEDWGVNVAGGLPKPPGISNVVGIAAGIYHNLALRADGTAVGWGLNRVGQARPPSDLTNVTALAAAGDWSMAVTAEGKVVGWGYGPLVGAIPADIDQVVAVAMTDSHALALKCDGTVVRWGLPSGVTAVVPEHIRDIVAIAAGNDGDYALRLPLKFSRIEKPDRPQLSFRAFAGRTYVVQTALNLTDGSWTELDTKPVIGEGREVTVEDPDPNPSGERFYRLTELP